MPANYFDAERQKWWWTKSDAVDKVKLLAYDYMYASLMTPACMHICAAAGDDRQIWGRSEASCGWWSGRLAERLQCASRGHSDGSNEQVSCRLLATAIDSRSCRNQAAPQELSLSIARKAGVGSLQPWHCWSACLRAVLRLCDHYWTAHYYNRCSLCHAGISTATQQRCMPWMLRHLS